MNVCPVCRNVNTNDATVCRYCNTALQPTSAHVAAPRPNHSGPGSRGSGRSPYAVRPVSQGASTSTAQAVGPPPIEIGTGEGASLAFEPKAVTAPADTEIAVTFTNHSTLPHNLTFEDPIAAKTTRYRRRRK